MPTLTGLHLFTYRVGFGDCFLLRFEYGKDDARHVLVDFGTSASPEQLGNQTKLVADHIRETCGEKLEAIVLTHRHSDHVSAFRGETWKVIAGLKPRLVVLPWTEHPDAKTDARVAPTGTRGKIGALSSAHARSLDAMHEVARAALDELARRTSGASPPGDDGTPLPDDEDAFGPWAAARDLGPMPIANPYGKRLAAELAMLGELNLKNAEQMKNLIERTPAQDFVCFGSRTRLASLLPGVKVHVLGPPTLNQSAAIREQAEVNREEYWHVMAAAGRASARANGKPLFPGDRTVSPSRLPLETRWFLKRLDAVRASQLLQIVRTLDDQLNNTSVILLFEAGGKKLLFPGDAQWENWSYALSQKGVADLLRDVDVYKVGHHGSLNATPRSMWKLLDNRGAPGKSGRLKCFLSTRKNKHGHRENCTEVPRETLVDELEANSDLFSTLELKKKDEFFHVERIV